MSYTMLRLCAWIWRGMPKCMCQNIWTHKTGLRNTSTTKNTTMHLGPKHTKHPCILQTPKKNATARLWRRDITYGKRAVLDEHTREPGKNDEQTKRRCGFHSESDRLPTKSATTSIQNDRRTKNALCLRGRCGCPSPLQAVMNGTHRWTTFLLTKPDVLKCGECRCTSHGCQATLNWYRLK